MAAVDEEIQIIWGVYLRRVFWSDQKSTMGFSCAALYPLPIATGWICGSCFFLVFLKEVIWKLLAQQCDASHLRLSSSLPVLPLPFTILEPHCLHSGTDESQSSELIKFLQLLGSSAVRGKGRAWTAALLRERQTDSCPYTLHLAAAF